MQNSDSECRAGAQSRTCRKVGIGMDFQTIVLLHFGQHLAHHWMHDFADFPDIFQSGICDAEPMLEKWRQLAHADVGILVDRGSEHSTAVLSKPGGIISTAAKQR